MTLPIVFVFDTDTKQYIGTASGADKGYQAEGDTLDEAMIMLELEIEKDYGVRDDT